MKIKGPVEEHIFDYWADSSSYFSYVSVSVEGEGGWNEVPLIWLFDFIIFLVERSKRETIIFVVRTY